MDGSSGKEYRREGSRDGLLESSTAPGRDGEFAPQDVQVAGATGKPSSSVHQLDRWRVGAGTPTSPLSLP